MELQIVLVTLCVLMPAAVGQTDFASLLGSLGFGGKFYFLLIIKPDFISFIHCIFIMFQFLQFNHCFC